MKTYTGASIKDCLAQAEKEIGSGGKYLIASITKNGLTTLILEKV